MNAVRMRADWPARGWWRSIGAAVFMCVVVTVSGGADVRAVEAPLGPVNPPRALSGMEAVILKDLEAMKLELQRLDGSLARPNVRPQAAAASSVPRLIGIWRAIGARVAVLKSQTAKVKDMPGTNRAVALERQMPALQQAINSLPVDAEGADLVMAKKKTKERVKNVEFLIIKMSEVFIT